MFLAVVFLVLLCLQRVSVVRDPCPAARPYDMVAAWGAALSE
jgi:hypothetical protein